MALSDFAGFIFSVIVVFALLFVGKSIGDAIKDFDDQNGPHAG